MKVVYTADDPMQAYAVKNFLEGEGIPAVVVGEGMFPLRGTGASFSADSLPQVCVTNDEDAPRALELLRQHRAPVEDPTPHAASEGVRWIDLFLVCLAAAALLAAVWFLLSPWLGLERW
jgi:CheY-like chemotaxis protein